MGKEDAPEGPNFKELISKVEKYVGKNNKLFQNAMKFGKDQFHKGEEWADKIEQFGTDAMGRLNQSADEFKTTTAARVAGLDKAGTAWGKAAQDIYGENKALAGKVTGELMPGMERSAELGGTLLDSYTTQGIPFQDEYIAKISNWDTGARREDRAAQAVSDIALTTEAAREGELRRLESYGIDPSQTRSAALDSRLSTQNAIAKAGAANLERRAVEAEGLTLGKTASDMYEARREAGMGATESAVGQGKAIADIARQPGEDFLATLAKLGQYGIAVGELERIASAAGFDMQKVAEVFGQAGVTGAATQFNANREYGSGVFTQGANINKNSADMIQGSYGTAGNLHANDLAATEMNNKNSFGAQLGTLAGVAAPFILGPAGAALGTAIGGAAGTAITGAATAAAGAPMAGTNLTNSLYRGAGGPVTKDESPSKGAIPDDVPALVDAGEFIFDRDTARWFGEKHLRSMQKQAKQGLGIPEPAGA